MVLFHWWFNSYGFMVAKDGCKVAEEGVGKLMMHKLLEE